MAAGLETRGLRTSNLRGFTNHPPTWMLPGTASWLLDYPSRSTLEQESVGDWPGFHKLMDDGVGRLQSKYLVLLPWPSAYGTSCLVACFLRATLLSSSSTISEP